MKKLTLALMDPPYDVGQLRPLRRRTRRVKRCQGVKRGSPADFFKMASESTNTLVIPTK